MKVTEFKPCGACGIYLIRNLINQHLYVGQTARSFINRWQEHIRVANNYNATKNVNLLTLALRKYGIDNFDFSVIEYCTKADLDSREQFWIQAFNAASHDNYNQTAGGQANNKLAAKPSWYYNLISDLLNSQISIKQLSVKYNITDSFIYEINCGNKYFDKTISYPIRKLVGNSKIGLYNLIISDIKNSKLSFNEIAKKYNCSLSLVKRLNAGHNNYYIEGEVYPIRKQKALDIVYIISLLSTTKLSYKQIAEMTDASEDSIYKINHGIRNCQKDISYPIRH